MGNRPLSFDSGMARQSANSFQRIHSGKHSPKRKRAFSSDSLDRDDYGWFEDFETPDNLQRNSSSFDIASSQPLHKALSLPPPVTEPPLYILESSLETQQLWYSTAGRRPKQPQQEREYFEKLWTKNFENSSIDYYFVDLSSSSNGENTSPNKKSDSNLATTPNPSTAGNGNSHKNNPPVDVIPKSEIHGEVLYRGKSPFSNSVSKSFLEVEPVTSMTLQMPYYRIFRTLDGDIHAEYLIKVTVGVTTFGIWKRHSDFCKLATQITSLNLTSKEQTACFKNALLSWQCVLQRKRWYRSLDKEYLALKCFLLERFMHDVLFEALTPGIISRFLGLEN